MFRHWRQLGAIAAVIATALLIAACGRDDDGGGGGGAGGAGSDPGITENEIKLGGSYPFSGPASAYRLIAERAKAHCEYVNQQKVPHVFVATGASSWGSDIKAHPWTIGWQPNYVTEAKVYADYLDKEKPS